MQYTPDLEQHHAKIRRELDAERAEAQKRAEAVREANPGGMLVCQGRYYAALDILEGLIQAEDVNAGGISSAALRVVIGTLCDGAEPHNIGHL